MLIVDDQLCFIHPPKTAGTSLRNSVPNSRKIDLNSNDQWEAYLAEAGVKASPQLEQAKTFTIAKHAPLGFWQRQGIVNDKHRILCICRNPFTRLVSYYLEVASCLSCGNQDFDAFIRGQSPLNSALNQLNRKELSASGNQCDFLIDHRGELKIDKSYKIEQDLSKLEQDLDSSLDLQNVRRYSRQYSGWYDKELIRIVQKQFERDFVLFDYDFDPFW